MVRKNDESMRISRSKFREANFNKFHPKDKSHESKRVNFANAVSKFLLILVLLILWNVNAYASIVLKAAMVNPSPDSEKEVELNVPLPKEVQPEHIISLGDLELDFDAQKNVYYAHKKFTLPPKGSIIREIEIMDIWVIDEQEIDVIRQEADKLWEVCKNSEYVSQVSFLKHNIDSKLNQITQSQKELALTPQEHISDYRKNLERLKEIKADMDNFSKVASKIKPVSTKAIGRLLAFVLTFLAAIAVSFIVIWRKYLRSPELEKLKSPEDVEE